MSQRREMEARKGRRAPGGASDALFDARLSLREQLPELADEEFQTLMDEVARERIRRTVRQVDPEFNPYQVMGPGDDAPRAATAAELAALEIGGS